MSVEHIPVEEGFVTMRTRQRLCFPRVKLHVSLKVARQ
jgi:hypothetical protein